MKITKTVKISLIIGFILLALYLVYKYLNRVSATVENVDYIAKVANIKFKTNDQIFEKKISISKGLSESLISDDKKYNFRWMVKGSYSNGILSKIFEPHSITVWIADTENIFIKGEEFDIINRTAKQITKEDI